MFKFFKNNKKAVAPTMNISKENEEIPTFTGNQKNENIKYDASAVIGGIAWYKRQYHSAMKLALCLGVSLGVSLCIIGALLLNAPAPVYYAATPDLRPLLP